MPATLTGIVAKCDPPGFQVNVPVYPDAVRVEVPLQLLTPLTVGATGTTKAAAVFMPDALVQPFTVVVTL